MLIFYLIKVILEKLKKSISIKELKPNDQDERFHGCLLNICTKEFFQERTIKPYLDKLNLRTKIYWNDSKSVRTSLTNV